MYNMLLYVLAEKKCYVFVYFLAQGMGSSATTPPAGVPRHGWKRSIGFVCMDTAEAVQDSCLQILMLHFLKFLSWHKWEFSSCALVTKQVQERISVVSGLDLNIPPSLGTKEAEDVLHHAPLLARTAVCREPRTRYAEGRKEKLHGDNIFK